MSILIGIGKNLRITPSGVIPFSYEDELLTYISGLVTPLSDAQLILLNNLILTLKTGLGIANLSDVFDVLYIFAGETSESSLRNLVKNIHHATLHGTANPVFTAYEGFMGDIANGSYINTNYNPHDDGIKFTINDSAFGLYSRTNRAASSTKLHGCKSGTDFLEILPLRASTYSRGYINATGYVNVDTTDSLGLYMAIRYGANSDAFAKNKTIVTGTNAVTAIPDYNLCLDAVNGSSGAVTFDDIQISLGCAGKSLSQAELNVLFDAFEAYMDANGKGVV